MEALIEAFGPGLLTWLVVIPVFIGVAALFWAMRYLLSAREEVLDHRIQRTIHGASVGAGQLDAADKGGESMVGAVMQPLAKLVKPKDAEELGKLQSQLSYAGLRGERHLAMYLGSKFVFCLLGGFGVLLFSAAVKPLDSPGLITVFAMVFGFYGPNAWLSSRVRERQGEINKALPDTLDLMVTCVEAGLGLDAALARVSEEVQLSSPIFADELNTVALEMRAGMSRADAFRRLGIRTGVDELRQLAAIIVQTEIFGTSVAKSLRVQADGMRIRRMQLAEERAAKVPVLLSIPLTLCVLPSLMTVLMGPAAVNIIRVLMPTLGSAGGGN